MINEGDLRARIASLLADYNKLRDKEDEAEKLAEEFIRELFESLGWSWRSGEIKFQKRIKSAQKTTRVDFSFKKSGELRPSFYLDAKRFSNRLEDPKDIQQVLDYGKNSGIRWVILTNFIKWRVFNSDYFDEHDNAKLFEFSLNSCLENSEDMRWLMLFSRDNGGAALDEYAKKHNKWKESESVEELLTAQLLYTREKLSKAIREQNSMLFDTTQENEDVSLDACVQHILDRIIFSRMLEDNGADPDLKMSDVIERWETDERVQLYREYICPFWVKMRQKYDSTIFDNHRIDGLTIKNVDFSPIVKSFYVNPKNKLRYRFEAMGADILGHAYENYLSYKIKQTAKRTGLEIEIYKRKQSGIYYTPKFLVDYLVMNTLGERLRKCKTPDEVLKIRVLDPACGSGTFLVRAFEEFKAWFEEYERKNPGTLSQTRLDNDGENGTSNFLNSVLEKCLYGIDLDPRAVRLAKLNLFLRAIDTPKQLPRLNIFEKNSLVWDDDAWDFFKQHTFKFERDLPLIHEQGGFDVILGNPPWEKWKPNSQEFFEEYEPGFRDLPTQEAKKKIEELMKRKGVKYAWEAKLREYEFFSEIYRERYTYQSADANGKSVSGDLDLYKIFTERAHQLLKGGGMCGFVVPSGIYTDLGAKGLRTMLFEHSKIKALYSFENKGHAIFPDVHASYKFVLLVYEKGGKTKSFPCAFFLHGKEDLNKATENPTIMEIDFVKKSCPTSWGVLEIKNPKAKEILSKLLKYPSLGEKIEDAWNVEMQSGFHMTNDSHLFKTGLYGIPMLEGKNIEQFTHKWKEAPTPRYKILEKDITANLKPEKIYYKNYWMAYRDVASSTNYRTVISTIIPPGYVCGNTINIVRLSNLKYLCFLCGMMNSFVIDFFMRQKVSAHVNMFSFLETPIPRLSSGKEFDAIVRKVVQLVAVTPEFDTLKREVGVEHALTNENDRMQARAQLDAMVAKLYGVTKEELEFILKQFPIADEKQKEMVLNEY